MIGKDDLIRRQDAIKSLEKWKEGEARTVKDYGKVFVLGRTSAFADAIAAMVFVPSAELVGDGTHEKRGKWIKTRHGYMNGMPIYKCSNCTNFRLSREDGDMIEHYYFTARFPYCPGCGARMEQEERK